MSKKKNDTAAAEDNSTEIKAERIEVDPEESVREKVAAAEKSPEQPGAEQAVEEAEPEADWEDRFLRLAAEFDNYKKRTSRQYTQIIKSAEGELIGELTEVLDNLERALDPEHRNAKLGEFVKGIDLIFGQFKAVLEKRGLSRIGAVGEPFDPEKHEAVMQVDSDDVPAGHVVREISPGYMLGERVLRHTKVMVSRGPAEPGEETESGTGEEED